MPFHGDLDGRGGSWLSKVLLVSVSEMLSYGLESHINGDWQEARKLMDSESFYSFIVNNRTNTNVIEGRLAQRFISNFIDPSNPSPSGIYSPDNAIDMTSYLSNAAYMNYLSQRMRTDPDYKPTNNDLSIMRNSLPTHDLLALKRLTEEILNKKQNYIY